MKTYQQRRDEAARKWAPSTECIHSSLKRNLLKYPQYGSSDVWSFEHGADWARADLLKEIETVKKFIDHCIWYEERGCDLSYTDQLEQRELGIKIAIECRSIIERIESEGK